MSNDKKECKHEPDMSTVRTHLYDGLILDFECKHCGVNGSTRVDIDEKDVNW